MRAKKLVQTIIGSAGFVLEDITVNPEMNEINIAVRPTIAIIKNNGNLCRGRWGTSAPTNSHQ